MLSKELWIAGYPSFYGGADTELSHQIDLWRLNDIDVNLVPMFSADTEMRKICDANGCKTHIYSDTIFKDKIVVSFCNGEFLKKLPDIVINGKPKAVVWFNCMTTHFPLELVAHKNEWINFHGFVSNYQKNLLLPQLNELKPVQELEDYHPYFNPQNAAQRIEFKYNIPDKWFSLGRISRDDYNKFSDDMWNIFYKVCTPRKKKVFVLGYGTNAHQRCGEAPGGLDWQIWAPNAIPVKEVYKILHCIVHKTGGSRESYCRIVPEAYASGVPIITEDDYAFPDLIDNGVTGYRCKTSDEMSFRASELAFDEEKRKKIIFNAHDYLIHEIASKERCWKAWEKLFKEV
jgi:glycosyltransferase involved in cell wall biosynthesis